MSAIINACKTLQRQKFWLKLTGYLCIPCFCIGFSCIVCGDVLDTFYKKYKQVIAFYGGAEELEKLSIKIKKELGLFREAVTFANFIVEPSIIRSNTTIIDVIFDKNARVKKTLSESFDFFCDYKYSKNNDYIDIIWNKYISLGGCYHVLIYGYIEYMCMVVDPTCSKMEHILNKITSDTAFRSECLFHKEESGFQNNSKQLEHFIKVK